MEGGQRGAIARGGRGPRPPPEAAYDVPCSDVMQCNDYLCFFYVWCVCCGIFICVYVCIKYRICVHVYECVCFMQYFYMCQVCMREGEEEHY